MLRSQKHPVVLEKRYPKVLSQWGCHKVTEVSRILCHLGVKLALARLRRGRWHTCTPLRARTRQRRSLGAFAACEATGPSAQGTRPPSTLKQAENA